MIYLTLGNLIVRSPEQGHPQRVHVHLWGVKKKEIHYSAELLLNSTNILTNNNKSKEMVIVRCPWVL